MPNEFIDLQYAAVEGRSRQPSCAVCDQAEAAVRAGKLVLLLSDRYLKQDKIPIHALLATGAVHHRLVKKGLRCKCNIIVETGTARDPHHFACLIGYGATAVYPYMAYQTLFDMMRKSAPTMDSNTRFELGRSYRKASARACSRSCRRWAFRPSPAIAAGSCSRSSVWSSEVVDLCFRGTVSRIQGANFDDLEADQKMLGDPRLESDSRPSSRAACSSSCTAASTTCTTRT